MTTRQLGNTDLQIAPLVLGTNVFGWTIDEAKSFEILDAFIDAGGNLIDTADVYAKWAPGNMGGESETIIGNWLAKRNNRSSVFIATKVGSDMGNGKTGVGRQYILEAVEESLRRLQTDYIDLYQTHFDDPSTPVDEALEAYDLLLKAGKVRWTGASNISADRLLQSLQTSVAKSYPVYHTLQPEYNLYNREKFETVYENICLQNNLGVITYFSLASGFLTGKYRHEGDFSKSVRGGGMKKYLDARGLAILHALDQVAEKHRTNATAIALAWLMARPSVTAPIASATSTAQLNDLMHATRLELSAEDIAVLDKASAWK